MANRKSDHAGHQKLDADAISSLQQWLRQSAKVVREAAQTARYARARMLRYADAADRDADGLEHALRLAREQRQT